MIENKKKRKLDYVYLALLFVVMLVYLLTPFSSTLTTNAESAYSDVLEDLQKDESFNIEDYPVVEEDYSLQVIQIVETTDKELLVYVYQPYGNLRANAIRFSTGINRNLSPEDYTLVYLNSNGTLFKYKVDNFQVLNDIVRYYEVISIYREYIEGVDNPPSSEDQIIVDVAFDVSTRWTACTLDEKVTYQKLKIDTIKIENKRVGQIEYFSGFLAMVGKRCYSHYVAFSTDFLIDDLKEADVSFYSQKIVNDKKQGDAVFNGITLTEYDSAVVLSGLFNSEHEFQRIISVSDFIEENDLKDEVKEELSKMQWVLRFTETESISRPSYTSTGVPFIYSSYTKISEVTVLKLRFETEGKVYNLGVVDNKQTGSGVPDNPPFDFLKWLEEHVVGFLLTLLAVIIFVPLFIAFFPQIMVGLVKVGKWFVKGLWWILTLPYQLFKNE